MISFSHVVVDCLDAHALADFWCRVLGTEVVYDWDIVVIIEGTPRLSFQQVPEPTPGKNRIHFDVNADDLAAETERLVGLGATMLEHVTMDGGSWNVMTDPEGNVFCLAERFDLEKARAYESLIQSGLVAPLEPLEQAAPAEAAEAVHPA